MTLSPLLFKINHIMMIETEKIEYNEYNAMDINVVDVFHIKNILQVKTSGNRQTLYIVRSYQSRRVGQPYLHLIFTEIFVQFINPINDIRIFLCFNVISGGLLPPI